MRAFNPWPVAYCEVQATGAAPRSGSGRLRIWAAQALDEQVREPPGTVIASPGDALRISTGRGILQVDELQAAGGKRMTAREFLNARHVPKGTTLSPAAPTPAA